MDCTLYICMTSGVEGPSLALTEDQSRNIISLALQLNKPWVGTRLLGLSSLRQDHFLVAWEDPNSQIMGLRAETNGYVSMWKHGDTDWHEFQDTVGLWTHLAPYGSTAYQNWIRPFTPAAP